MQEILIATLVVGVVGLLLGLALVTASKKFYVEVDDRVTKVRECLRGANCGACGYAGCDAVAEAIVKGEARVDACPGNSTENIAKIAAILGKETIHQDPQVAFIRCGGTCNATKAKGNDVAGHVNVFVFPDLCAGNIGYKAVQRSSGAVAVGPVLQGLNRPVNDLSRGATVQDIINTVALTAIEAQ